MNFERNEFLVTNWTWQNPWLSRASLSCSSVSLVSLVAESLSLLSSSHAMSALPLSPLPMPLVSQLHSSPGECNLLMAKGIASWMSSLSNSPVLSPVPLGLFPFHHVPMPHCAKCGMCTRLCCRIWFHVNVFHISEHKNAHSEFQRCIPHPSSVIPAIARSATSRDELSLSLVALCITKQDTHCQPTTTHCNASHLQLLLFLCIPMMTTHVHPNCCCVFAKEPKLIHQNKQRIHCSTMQDVPLLHTKFFSCHWQ